MMTANLVVKFFLINKTKNDFY